MSAAREIGKAHAALAAASEYKRNVKDPPFFLTTKNDPDIPRRMKTLAPTRTRNQAVSINLEKSLTRYALATAGLAALGIPTTATACFSGYYAPSSSPPTSSKGGSGLW